MKKKSKLEKIENKLRLSNYSDKKEMLNYIKKGVFDFNEEILCDIFIIIIDNNYSFEEAMNISKELYNLIVFDDKNEEEKNIFLKLFSEYLNDFRNIDYFKDLYALFEDKKLFLAIFEKSDKVDSSIYEYIKEVRRYYVDEKMFFSDLLNVIEKVRDSSIVYDKEYIIKKALKKAKKEAGVFSISDEKIEELSKEEVDIECALINLSLEIDSAKHSLTNLKSNIDKSNKDLETDYEDINELYETVKKLTSEESINTELNTLSRKTEEISKILTKEKDVDIEKKETKGFSIENNELLNLSINRILSKAKANIRKIVDIKDNKKIDNAFTNMVKNIILEVNDFNELFQEEYFKFYYYALYNDTVEIFHEVTKNVSDFYKLDIRFFNKDVTSDLLERGIYYDLVYKKTYMFKTFIKNNDLNLLLILLEENKDFNLVNSINYEKLKEAFKVFSLKIFANLSDTWQENIASTDIENLHILKLIYDENKEFVLKENDIFKLYNQILNINELASLTNFHQITIINILDRYNFDAILKYKDIMKKIFLSNNEDYIPSLSLLNELLNDKRIGISIEDYLKLDYENQENLLDSYKEYQKSSIFNRSSSVKKMKKVLENS